MTPDHANTCEAARSRTVGSGRMLASERIARVLDPDGNLVIVGQGDGT